MQVSFVVHKLFRLLSEVFKLQWNTVSLLNLTTVCCQIRPIVGKSPGISSFTQTFPRSSLHGFLEYLAPWSGYLFAAEEAHVPSWLYSTSVSRWKPYLHLPDYFQITSTTSPQVLWCTLHFMLMPPQTMSWSILRWITGIYEVINVKNRSELFFVIVSDLSSIFAFKSLPFISYYTVLRIKYSTLQIQTMIWSWTILHNGINTLLLNWLHHVSMSHRCSLKLIWQNQEYCKKKNHFMSTTLNKVGAWSSLIDDCV